MNTLSKIVFAVCIILACTAASFFTIQNPTSVSLSFLYWKTPPVWVSIPILLAFILGFVFALVFFLLESIRTKTALRRQRKKAEKLQAEVDELRQQPFLHKESSGSNWEDSLENAKIEEAEPTHIDIDSVKNDS